MTASIGMGLGLLLTGLLAILVRVGVRSQPYRHARARRFVCPVLGSVVDCTLVQDARTGQWKGVESCSAFADSEGIPCEHDCMRNLNLGFALDGARAGEVVRS
jgi:hypothetical protein